MRRYAPPVALLALLISLCAALVKSPGQQDRLPDDALLLPRADLVRAIGQPVLHLVADYLWVMTTHQIGSARTRQQHRDIYSYADLLTDLDPQFRQPYLVAGVTIPFKERDGSWTHAELSTRLLEKGLKAFPDYIYLRIMLAYNYSQLHRNYTRAAEILEQASRIDGAPAYLGPLATRLYAQAGQFDSGLFLASSLAETAEDEATREAFRLRVRELESERVLRQVDDAVAAFVARHGRQPESIAQLVEGRFLRAVPVDPLGGEIHLDEAGRARSSAAQRRLTDFALPGSDARP